MGLSGFKASMAAKVKETAEGAVEVAPTTRKNGVGMGLLNNASQVERKVEEYPMIEIDNILPNEKNKYERNEIEDLMLSIKDVGLLQPLVGYYMSDGRVKLTTGHRRLEACKRLVEEDGIETYKRLPVKIKSIDDVDLDLSDDLKEKYLIIVTNNQRRNELTQAEMLFEVETLREIYAALKRNGKKPKGTTRGLIANDLGVDERTVARYTNISMAASDDVKEAFVNNDLDLQTTQELVKEEPEVQNKALKEISEMNKEEKTSGAKPVAGKEKAKKAIEKVKKEEESGREEKKSVQVSITEKDLKSARTEIEKASELLSSAVGKKISKEKKNFLFTDLKTLSGLLKEIQELLQ